MKMPFCRGRRKSTSATSNTSASATSTETFSFTCYFLACFAPLWRRNSTICHYSSVSVRRITEEEKEEESPKLEISIDDIPDPLLIDIFQRLPINSVFRSKCVSKRWLSLISDPHFSQSYSSRRQKLSQPFALFYISFIPGSDSNRPCEVGPYCLPFEEPRSWLTFPLNFFTNELQKIQKEKYPLELIGSSSDLLLFTALNQSCMDLYHVCNPLTFHWIDIPQPRRNQVRYPIVGFMVESDGTFWIVQILPRELQYSMVLVFQVFCSMTGKWCSKKVKCNRSFVSFCSKTTVVYKGIILWMVFDGLLAFDPRSESNRCHVINLPNNEAGKLGVSCGELYYYEVRSYDSLQAMENTVLRVWKMIDFEDGEWVLQHSIRYDHLWSSDESLKQFLLLPNIEKYFQWVCFNPVDSDVVFLKCDGQLVTCKLSSACLEIISCDIKQGIFYRLEWDVLPLVFRPWPTTFVQNSKETNGGLSSGIGQLSLSKLPRRRNGGL